ncbi:hypothetical protein SAMN04488498_104320 [Mesorhizobium albiziae]|uniref:Uncharacterized protein n=1 Tax=Neomesorhizobium albiziae TaxID=335020 RepID=A0A1I3YB90_9HYPH|nr:hypothetical protein [Mesorhizobium albiziae]GLS29975.1 hypothetical protein GCM10007937_16830 [Mesorhizobium albiziae]SFK29020.1 hypothetical protein SAMN04488498_104320 [Mesorhizobium albiziae]
MTIDPTVTLGNLLTIGALIVGALSAWFLLRGDVVSMKAAQADQKEKHDALAASYAALQKRAEEIRARGAHELAEYKLIVAREYATNEAIKEVETTLVKAIDRLGDRFDNYFDRGQTAPRRRGGSN